MIVQGDEYSIPFTIYAGETAITASMVREVIVRFGNVQKCYSKSEITWSNDKWHIPLTHEETLTMQSKTPIQVDVFFIDGTVRKRSKIQYQTVEPAIIEERGCEA